VICFPVRSSHLLPFIVLRVAFETCIVEYLGHCYNNYFLSRMHLSCFTAAVQFHVMCSLSRFEAIPDKLAPDEILRQAQRAAKAAADKLSSQVPNSKVHISCFYVINSIICIS